MKTYKLMIVTLLSLFLGVTACTPESSSRKRSYVDGDFDIKKETSELTEKQRTETEELLALIEQTLPILKDEESKTEAEMDLNLVYQKILIPLRPYALNIDYLSDPAKTTLRLESGYFPLGRIIEIFNRAIILINANKKSLIADSDILPTYKNIILDGCDETLSGSCYFLKFYRGVDSVNMTRIIKMIHDRETSDIEKERLIRAAFEIKNRRLDASLRFMLLERLSQSMKSEKAKTITRRRLKQDADLFANILRIDIIGQDPDDKYTALVKALDPWKLSRTVDDAKNQAMTEILALAGSHLLYKENGSLTPEFKEAIDDIHYRVGSQYEQGVKFQRENIKGHWKKAFDTTEPSKLEGLKKNIYEKTKDNREVELFGGESHKILSNLLQDVKFKYDDEYYFLAHQIFYNHFNIDDANAFWNATEKNQHRLMDAALNLIKMQIINNIVFTNARMNKFYDRNKNTKLIQLLRESDQEGSKVRKSWIKLITRSNLIKNFISRVYVSLKDEDVKKFREIESKVDALQKNIKYLVTYPNMFPLMYVLSENQATETIDSFFGTFEIGDATIIRMFFSGEFPPWFNFGNDGNRLDPTEIIYSYHYALKTQIFKTYEKSEVIKYTPEKFFERVIKKMLYTAETTLQENLDRIQKFKNNTSSQTRSLIQSCQEEIRIQDEIEKDRFEELRLKVEKGEASWEKDFISTLEPRTKSGNTIAFEELGNSIYNLTDTAENRRAYFMSQLFSDANSKLLRLLRTEIHEKSTGKDPAYSLALPRILLELYKLEYPEDIKRLEGIEATQFAEYNRLKAELIKTLSESTDQLKKCPLYFHRRDRDIRQALIFREAQYYGELYDALAKLHSSQLDPVSYVEALESKRKEFNEATQDETYPEVYRNRYGYNVFRKNKVVTYKMDIMARLKSHLSEVFPNQYEITMPSDFDDISEYEEKNPSELDIHFSTTPALAKFHREEFVKAGIEAMEKHLGWATGVASIHILSKQSDFLVELFKLGKISKHTEEKDCETYEVNSDNFKKNCYKLEAKEVIDHFDGLIDVMRISDRDRVILGLTGNFSKYNESDYEKIIKREDGHRLYDRFDLAFRKVYTDEGSAKGAKTWFIYLVKKYIESVQKRRVSTFIFQYDDKVEEILNSHYGQWIKDYYGPIKEFLAEIKGRKIENQDQKYSYHVNRSYVIGQSSHGELSPKISNLIYGKFNEVSDDIRQQTSSYFLDLQRPETQTIKDIIKGKALDEVSP